MSQTYTVDGNEYTFPAHWKVFIYDEWAFYRKKLTSAPLHAKACDLVAHDGDTLYLIEAKDYSRPDSVAWPGVKELAEKVAVKGFHTLAGLMAGAKLGGERWDDCEAAIRLDRFKLCLAVEFHSKKQREVPRLLKGLKDGIERSAPYLRSAPLVATFDQGDKPWESRRVWHLTPA